MLITLSGPDGVGKATQSSKLLNRLSAERYNVELFTVPDYQTPTGNILNEKRQQNGNEDADQLLYFSNLYEVSKNIQQSRADIVICDRYILDAFVYAHIHTKLSTACIKEILSQVVQPNLQLILMGYSNKAPEDKFEKDTVFQQKSRSLFLNAYSATDAVLVTLDTFSDLPVEEAIDTIHEVVYDIVIREIRKNRHK